MICPACRQPMIVVEYKRIELDFCPNCHGTWFDHGELELLLESAAVIEEPSFIQNVLNTPDARTGEKKRRCPICGKKMRKVHAGDNAGVLLDACGQGDGLWFDGGEVDRFVDIVDEETHRETGHDHIFSFMKEVFKVPTG
jgi:Zn-finger nucleic acid-binding protein